MKFWINKDAAVDNVLILAKNGVLIAECEEEHVEAVAQKLAGKMHPLDIFGKDKTKKIPFRDITRLVSRNTDCDLIISFKPDKEEKEEDYTFETEQARRECLKVLDIILPEHFKKSVTQQSAIMAALPPLLSLVLAGFASWLYFDIYRWLTIIIGGLWIAGSLYMLYYRFSKPPEVTRWTLKGKYISKTWNNLKAFVGYLAFAAVVIGWALAQPKSYGPQAVVENMLHDELEAEDIGELVKRGGDVNYRADNGSAPLHLAIEWEENHLIPVLIEHGADTAMPDADDMTPMMVAIRYSNEPAVNAILDSGKPFGALDDFASDLLDAEFSAGTLARLRERGVDIPEPEEEAAEALE